MFNDQLEVGTVGEGATEVALEHEERIVAEVDEGLSPADVLGRIEQVCLVSTCSPSVRLQELDPNYQHLYVVYGSSAWP